MNLIRIFVCCISCTFLLLSSQVFTTYANTEEQQYIVEFIDDISLFSDYQNIRFNILTESELNECIQAGIVERYEEDYIVELFEATSTNSVLKWDLDLINASKATNISCEGQNVNVGVIDSGVIPHPDLLDSIKTGYNFLTQSTDVTDNKGHGTFVSGLIAANPNVMNINGIAPKANIIPLKCFDNDYTTRVSTICSAIYDAVDVYKCDIINMSFGLTSYSENLEKAVKYATDNGVIVVAAVGNKGTQTLYYPAAFENVIGVGSVDENCQRSTFSQYNDSVFVVAPGENVWSTNAEGTYSQKSGTSFAAPLVTGMITIMMNVEEDIDYAEVINYLKQSSTDLGTENYDTSFGHGMINVGNCIDQMLQEKKFFVSPIETDNNISFVTILNNSSEQFKGYCMWGEYKNRYMKDMDWDYVELNPEDTITVETNLTKNKLKCFLWRNMNDITTISNVRESEEQ